MVRQKLLQLCDVCRDVTWSVRLGVETKTGNAVFYAYCATGSDGELSVEYDAMQ